jgi:hypothetical protein
LSALTEASSVNPRSLGAKLSPFRSNRRGAGQRTIDSLHSFPVPLVRIARGDRVQGLGETASPTRRPLRPVTRAIASAAPPLGVMIFAVPRIAGSLDTWRTIPMPPRPISSPAIHFVPGSGLPLA